MNYWLMKTEPSTFGVVHLAKKPRKTAMWDGVRNYQARNNLNAMKKGDAVLFYHSNEGLAVVGIARVIKEAYQDPTTEDQRWVVVDLEPVETLQQPVTLNDMKQDARLQNIGLIRQGRLSVMPLTKEEFAVIVARGQGEKALGFRL